MFEETDDLPTERHACIGFIDPTDPETIVFVCQKCDYRRWLNWKTGRTEVKGGSEYVLHSGGHAPMNMTKQVEQSQN